MAIKKAFKLSDVKPGMLLKFRNKKVCLATTHHNDYNWHPILVVDQKGLVMDDEDITYDLKDPDGQKDWDVIEIYDIDPLEKNVKNQKKLLWKRARNN